MRKSILIKSLLRVPAKTVIIFVLLLAIAFGLFARVFEYVVTRDEFRAIEATFQGTGTVEVTPPERLGAESGFFLTGGRHNPYSIDGTWEHTRYVPLTTDIQNNISNLPYVTSTDTRFIAAGVHDTFFRLDDKRTIYNYATRVIMEATLVSYTTTVSATGLDDISLPYANRMMRVRFTEFTPLSEVPDELQEVLGLQDIRDFVFQSGFRGEFPDYLPAEDIDRITVNWGTHAYAWSTSLRADFVSSPNQVDNSIVDNFVEGNRYIVVARFDPLLRSMTMGDPTVSFWLDSLIKPIPPNTPDYLYLPEFADFRKLIDITNQDLRTFDVVYTNNMASISRFANGFAGMAEGRLLTPYDYGTTHAVISHVLAEAYNLGLGDTITLGLTDRLHNQHVGLGAVSAGALGRFATPVKDVTLTIVGIYTEFTGEVHQGNHPHWSYSSNTIFVPRSLLPATADTANHPIHPGEFSFIIGNVRNVRQFRAQYASIIEDEMGLRLTLTDSGWGAIETEFMLTQQVALMAIIALVLTMVAAVVLVVYLFIIQRKKEYAIMRATGCTKYRANMAVFFPLLVIGAVSIVASGLGAWVYTAHTMGESISPVVVGASMAAVLGCLFVAAWGGLMFIGRIPPLALLQGGYKPKVRKKIASGTAATGFKFVNISPVPAQSGYGFISHCASQIGRNITRSRVKSGLMVLVSGALFVAVGQFVAMWQATQVLYETLPVEVTFFDRLTPGRASGIYGTGLVKDPYFERFGGAVELDNHPSVFMVTVGEGYQAQLAITNDIPRFYDDSAYVDFLPGYSFESMAETGGRYVLVPPFVLENPRLNLQLGDYIEINRRIMHVHTSAHKIVGVWNTPHGASNIVFVPPGMSHQGLFYPGNSPQNPTIFYDLVAFTVADNHQIEELVSTITALGVDHNQFHLDTYTLDRTRNNLAIFEMLFPIILGILAIIGGLLPGLMVLQSARAAALYRVIGTSKTRTRFILAGQQLCLCLVGLALGVAVIVAINGIIKILAISLGVFALCYILGIIICTAKVTRPKALELLQVKE